MTQLTFYNSLTHSKEPFQPIKPGHVGLYSCGPTIYDHAHIGNLRSFLMADLLQRVLSEVGDYEVDWVMNITDIDDKMIARAHELHPDTTPMTALELLADEYDDKFLQDLTSVGVDRDDLLVMPRATDHIAEMQTLITQLLDEGIAYIADGSIYFSLSKYEANGQKYGQLINIDYDPQARIDDQDQKQGAGDFALWKATQAGEPSWDYEVNGQNLPGRPGWHIECSAMSTKYLGREFDLHTGGVDLKFPHHENEIAQCGGVLAHYWLHGEHLQVEGAKMAKSAGNFTKLADIDDPLAFRLLMLQAHYRSQLDFSRASYSAAHQRLQALREWASRVANNPHPAADIATVNTWVERFDTAVADDLGTPAALAVVAEAERSGLYGPDAYGFVRHLDAVLGLQLLNRDEMIDDTDIQLLIAARVEAREQKDFTLSDQIRDQLRELEIGVEDTPDGQIVWKLTA